MSEQKTVQPISGSATADRATLKWSHADDTLSFRIGFEVPNACYSAGATKVETRPAPEADKSMVVVRATVDYTSGMCAQVVQEIVFEGSHAVDAATFDVRAEVLDKRTDRTTVIE